MPPEHSGLLLLSQVFGILAATFATLFPMLYMIRSRRRVTWLGVIFLAMSVSNAMLIDTMVLFRFWRPGDPETVLITETVEFAFVAFTSILMTAYLLVLQQIHREELQREQQDIRSR